MKKVLFLQNEGKTYGGVSNVNKLLGENLIKNNYEVHIISIRDNKHPVKLFYDKKMIVKTINEKEPWDSYHLVDLISQLKEFNLIKSIKIVISKIKYNISLKNDIKKLQNYIHNYNPNYIISSHYQMLDMIPKEYLNKTIHVQHSSFQDAINNSATKKTFDKFNNKIKFVWLSKKSLEKALENGYYNNTYIYNAVRFKSLKRSDVINNKRLVTISRLSSEKRIDLMVEIVQEIFKNKKYCDWTFEIYGTGLEEEKINNMITNHKQIKLMGLTNNPKDIFLKSSINLNTSLYEGFSLSILEANECGVPTISFDFGESTSEQILNNKTGIISKSKNDYKKELMNMMNNSEYLNNLSINVKKYSKEFQIENIINKWIHLFNEFDK